jgi:serine/threonine protein phosphatase PrpC
MQSHKELKNQKLEKLKSLRTYQSETNLDPVSQRINDDDLQRLKDYSNALIRGTMSKISETSRQTRDIISIAREEINTTSRLPSLEVSKIIRNKPHKLPKLQAHESPRPHHLLEMTSSNVSTLMNTTSSSKSTTHLVPLFSVANSVTRAGFKSRVGTIKGKPKLHNQDSVLIQANLMKIRGQYLFGISDGHGSEGHLISEHIKENYLNFLQLYLSPEPSVESAKTALVQATLKTEESLRNTKIDRTFSGATLICVFICGNILVCASLGDCKAVIGSFGVRWEAVSLYFLHNLQNKRERERMIQNHARIAVEVVQETGEVIGCEKAYMGDDNTPGLQITRSIGDKIGKYIGITANPEIKEHYLTPDDKFLIIGSTGLWKVLNEIEVICIVRTSWEENKVDLACEELISEADRRWKLKNEDKEDISVIVVFFGVN